VCRASPFRLEQWPFVLCARVFPYSVPALYSHPLAPTFILQAETQVSVVSPFEKEIFKFQLRFVVLKPILLATVSLTASSRQGAVFTWAGLTVCSVRLCRLDGEPTAAHGYLDWLRNQPRYRNNAKNRTQGPHLKILP